MSLIVSRICQNEDIIKIKIGKFIASSLCKMCWNYIYVQVKSAAENFNDYMMRRKTGEEKYRFKCMTLA
ncbi:hypothetical protein T09_7018 [Trichinella sp. T9]|nr:hypothetical protein T09_7018 [Trichinella sp. T9]